MDAHPSEHKPPSVIPKVNATSTTKTTIMKRRPGYSSVKEILSSEHSPSTFRLHARVTDFFPMSLRDCIVLSCGLCDHEVAGRLPKCSACGGSEHRYVFRLFFCLEDDSIEEPLLVHVDGGWSELAGLLPAELAKEDDPTDILLDRLGDSIGNLVQVHDTLGEVQLDTSPRDFTITSWAVPSDETGEGPEIAYGLR
ncbi:hypothetical protein OF83DRAFT_1113892 [Amylostereum chailletii]|nr:hypothetical protein OF83DRAFT_1113892 [Amylostereum chailletii]